MRVRKPPNCTIYESFVLLWLTAGWNLQSHFAVSLGSYTVQPIRCCLAKSSRLWVGYWNKVHVVDLDSRTTQVNRTLKQRNRITLNVCDAGLVGYLSHPTVIIFLTSQQTFTVSERGEQQVRFLCAAGSGVWASCRLDPVLRLFDWSTGRPLQELDLSTLVTKALGAKMI